MRARRPVSVLGAVYTLRHLLPGPLYPSPHPLSLNFRRITLKALLKTRCVNQPRRGINERKQSTQMKSTAVAREAHEDEEPVPVTMFVFAAASDIRFLCDSTTDEADHINGAAAGSTAPSNAGGDSHVRWSFVPSDSEIKGTDEAAGGTQQRSSALRDLRVLTGEIDRHTRFFSGAHESGVEGGEADHLFLAQSDRGGCPQDAAYAFRWVQGALDVTGEPFRTAGAQRKSLLCVDVGGVYVASPAASLSNEPRAPPPSSAHAKPSRAATKPLHKGVKDAVKVAAFFPAASTAPAAQRRSTAHSLDVVLRQRLSSAQTSFPFHTSQLAALKLTAVWVVPLRASDTPCWSRTSWLPLDCFPEFVAVAESGVGAERHNDTAWSTKPRDCVRLAQYTADLRLHIPCREEVAFAAHRKRPRDNTPDNDDDDDHQRCLASLAAAEDLEVRKSVSLQPRTLPASPVQLRVIESSFLVRSCYFSKWCCPDDFDVTSRFFSSCSDGARSCSQCVISRGRAYHPFYSALRRSAASEGARVATGLEASWCAPNHESVSATERRSCSLYSGSLSVQGGGGRRCGGDRCPLAQPPADDLFDDTHERSDCGCGFHSALTAAPAQHGGSTAQPGTSLASLPVWPLRVVWDMWTRLGWVPPARGGCFLVQMDAADVMPSSFAAEERRDGRPRWFTPAEWTAFVVRCADSIDDAYVRQVLASLGHEGGDAKLEMQSVDDEVDEQQGSMREAPQTLPAQIFAVNTEQLNALHRLFSMRAALLDAEVGAEESHFAQSRGCGARCPAFAGVTGIKASLPHSAASLCVSAAAQALAADIAATTPGLDETHSSAEQSIDAAQRVDFSVDFALGVLEAPMLLFPFLPPSDATDGVALRCGENGATAASAGAGAAFGPASAELSPSVSSFAVNARLYQKPTAVSDQNTSEPPAVATTEEEEEAYCELVDVAELRWRGGQLSMPPRSTALSHATTPHSCACCCSQACSGAAARFRGDAHGAGKSTCAPAAAAAGEDVLTRWLGTAFDAFVGRNGTESPVASVLADASVSSPVDRCAAAEEEHEEVCQTDASAVNGLLTATIVRCVQQNKAVVRRLMQLVQTYEGETATTADTSDSDGDECEALAQPMHACGAPAVRWTRQAEAEAEAFRVWRCLDSTRDAPAAGETEASFRKECARDLAARQLHAFWASVAATTRQALSQTIVQGSDTNSHTALATRTVHPVAQQAQQVCGEDACAAAAETECMAGNADASAVSADLNDALLHRLPCGTSTATRTLSPDAVSSCATSPLPTVASKVSTATHSEDQSKSGCALQTALAALNGPQAMQLYMRHILRCRSSSHSASPSLYSIQESSAALLPTACTEAATATTTSGTTQAVSAAVAKRVSGRGAAGGAAADGHAFADHLQPNLWLQHALFLLSYGASAPPAVPPPPPANQPRTSQLTRASNPLPERDGVVEGSCPFVVSPSLATFRMLRGGKMVLDTWIVAALDEYASRWCRACALHEMC